jgi:hypothetical protein
MNMTNEQNRRFEALSLVPVSGRLAVVEEPLVVARGICNAFVISVAMWLSMAITSVYLLVP